MAIVYPSPVQSLATHPGNPDSTYGNTWLYGDPATMWGDSSQGSAAQQTIPKSALGVPQSQNSVGGVFPATTPEPGEITLTVVWSVLPDAVGGLAMLLRANDGSYTGYATLMVASVGGVQTTTVVLNEDYWAVYGFGPQGYAEFLGALASGSMGLLTTPYLVSGVAPNDQVMVYEAYLTVPDAEPPPPPPPPPVVDLEFEGARRRFT